MVYVIFSEYLLFTVNEFLVEFIFKKKSHIDLKWHAEGDG